MKKTKIKELFLKLKKHPFYILLVFVSLYIVLIGLCWLVLSILLFTAIYKMVFSIRMLRDNLYLNGLTNLVFIILLAIFCRLLIFEVYMIPSESMEDALFPGDIILVSKLNYGPKLPKRPQDIPWINLFFKNSTEFQKEGKSGFWPYRRLPGFSNIKHGNIVVFKKPDDDKDFLIKRCIGMPGDKFQMKNSEVLINDKITFQFPTVKKDYQLICKDYLIIQQLADSLHFQVNKTEHTNKICIVTVRLNHIQYKAVENEDQVLSISPAILNWPSYPLNGNTDWTVDNMGPFIIPFRGMKISLDSLNYLLYQSIINSEHVNLVEKDGKYFINGMQTASYIFKQNYYFMLGDNRSDSSDSRFWGYIAESDIVGKQIMTLF